MGRKRAGRWKSLRASGVVLSAGVLAALALSPATALAGDVAPAAARIQLERTFGPPTTSVQLRGQGFGPSETIDVLLDGVGLRYAVTGPNGTFLTRITIPASALPGPHRVKAVGETSGRSARTSFTVRTDWPKFHFDDGNSGYNPYENVLDPSNVSGLQALWSTFTNGQIYDSSPAVVNGMVYIGNYGGGSLFALDASTGTVLWSFATGPGNPGVPAIYSSPAVVDGVVYFGARDHDLYALDASTGTKAWSFTAGAGIYSSPAVANGVVYAGSLDHNVYAVSASTGQKLWSYRTGGQVISDIAVENGVVYAGSSDTGLYALDATTGTKLWTFFAAGWVYGAAISNGVVYVGGHDLHALSASTGSELWSSPVGDVSSTPAVAGGTVYVGSGDQAVHALSSATGDELWSFATGSTFSSSPAVANGVVYVGGNDDNLYALDASKGTELRSFATRSGISSSPAVADGVVYFGSGDDSIYALGLAGAPVPPARSNASMAYDSATGSMVLWGGTGLHGSLSDTWTWDGSAWAEQHPVSSPPPNFAAPMAFDPGTGEVVLLTVQGTWTWDGSNWTSRVPKGSGEPSGGYAEMAYDPAVGSIVLFDQDTTTWIWDGSNWVQQHPVTSPSLRYLSSLAYSPSGQNLVLFGGYGDGNPNNPLDETWTWDGSNWTRQQPADVPMPRHGAGSADDPVHGTVVLFSGCCGSPILDDTWTWDGTDWIEQAPQTSPPSLDGSSMAYDPGSGDVLLFGGRQNDTGVLSDETWVWNGANWSLLT